MQSKHHHARPVVLRELSLLRALGASLRTSRRPARLHASPRPLGILPKADAVGMLAPKRVAPLVPDKNS
jgi:hypothetical protein